MATHSPTTARAVMKPVPQPSPIARMFPRVIVALAAYIEAERDAESDWATDPACMEWLHDAERARSTVLCQIQSITDQTLRDHGDFALKATAMLAGILIRASSTAEFLQAYALLGSHPGAFGAPTGSSARVQQMLQTARERLAELGTLSACVDPYDAEVEAELATAS
ncbi:hypothetical protein H9N28_16480 [Rhodobacter capsulatus]|uniref:hypothetical protein n=1 Tax=Rhodobacter capsulatus TaxID=1061 RepID=UPI000A488F67|nr:hypothetical protein [Rhodobacter capsulatus]PZX22237.1 hypothetical protein LY44_02965 [Rhodobacter capsulatus]QNR63114.1 hypothetical protein H9N28_16480 [Rhodobacter capsulatus]